MVTLATILDGLEGRAADSPLAWAPVLADCRRILGEAVAALPRRADGRAHPFTKNVVSAFLRCPAMALTPPPTGPPTIPMLRGKLVERAVGLALLADRTPPGDDRRADRLADPAAVVAPLADPGRFLSADVIEPLPPIAFDPVDDLDLLTTLVNLTETERADLIAQVVEMTRTQVATLPLALPRSWWPRVEEPFAMTLADGRAMLRGRVDVALGGPPSGRPGVVVELKSGPVEHSVRSDGYLYALGVAARDGVPPAVVVTIWGDGTTLPTDIRPDELLLAAHRTADAIWAAERAITAPDGPDRKPSWWCQGCGQFDTCPVADRRSAGDRRDKETELGPADDEGADTWA